MTKKGYEIVTIFGQGMMTYHMVWFFRMLFPDGSSGGKTGGVCGVGQERLGPSYFFISLVLVPLNSLLWYVPSSRYVWSSVSIFCFCKNNKRHHHHQMIFCKNNKRHHHHLIFLVCTGNCEPSSTYVFSNTTRRNPAPLDPHYSLSRSSTTKT